MNYSYDAQSLRYFEKRGGRNSAEIALQILSHFSWLNYEDKLHSIFCKSKASLNKMEEIHSYNTVFGAVLSI